MDSYLNGLQYLQEKSVLVIGATGFLGKVIIEKILRIQPNVKKLYLLVRANDDDSAMQRILNEIVEKELFKIIRERWGENLHSLISEKVKAIPADISYENFGVQDSDLMEEMCGNIDLIINVAATTRFDERYDVALGINTMGAHNLLSFAKRCGQLKLLLHVSTAYVCGEASGVVLEKPFKMGETLNGTNNLDIATEKKLVQETLYQLQLQKASQEVVTSTMKDLGLERSRLYGWPNTYVFTKAMGEMVLSHHKDNIPLVILRPTIITSTYKQPFPGWTESLRTIDSIISAYGKGKLSCLPVNFNTIFDLIPVDMVVNALMMALIVNANEYPSHLTIYHIGSSVTNPIKFSHLHAFTLTYFTQNPYVDRNGKMVKVSKGTILDSWNKFETYMNIRYFIPLKALRWVNFVFFNFYEDKCNDYQRKIKLAMRLANLYRPFMFFEGIFDDTNLGRLRNSIKGSELDVDEFNSDPSCIKWEDYITNTHIPSLVKYVIR